ncbi:sulfatase [Croceivirga sp. JEA036]|uniref:sulfatase family protein n=1 Tax=Croceivirga sp. JEA036 TaxID=2721162 RepID=UPI00143B090D|nr:sulfatase [Croceivirga sp. JEA036]NJB37772.1 sulfatase [Croceivirga sp. JEA036]
MQKKCVLGVLTNKGKVLLIFSCLVFAFSACKKIKENTKETAKPNIVWILLEDWSPDLSCYGTKGIHTPFTDQLAAEGVRYTNAFCTAPVCSTSRSAMITGYHQNYIGAQMHRTAKEDKKPLPQGIFPIPVLLQKAGYHTALMKSNKTDTNFRDALGFQSDDWDNRKDNQPFFAQITLTGTHRRWRRDTDNPIPIDSVELPPYYVDSPFARRDWANGLEQMQLCDKEVGEILQRLQDENLTENTLVILIGDNGRCHIRGKQFLYDPGIQVPLIMRWPAKIKKGSVKKELVQTLDITATILDVAGIKPARPLHGTSLLDQNRKERSYIYAARDRMGKTHDAMRTIRSKKYKLIHNLMPERAWLQYSGYKEDNYPILAEMSVLYLEGKLNADQAKFFAPTKPEYELYDIQKDPYELQNLADDKGYADIKTQLLTDLELWRKEIKDEGVTEEFRNGGLSANYPTRTLEEWRARYNAWKSYVNRAPDDPGTHPFSTTEQ